MQLFSLDQHRPTPEDADRACDLIQRMTDTAGSGRHCATLSLVDSAAQGSLISQLAFIIDGEFIIVDKHRAMQFSYLMSVAVSGKFPCGFLIRTFAEDAHDIVRGWKFADGDPIPLTAAESLDAYCYDRETGELVGPPPGVNYADAPVIHI